MEIFSFFILFLCAVHLSYARHILYPGESLSPNQNLVSENGEFKFGFFAPGNLYSPEQSTSYYYIGIWLSETGSQVQPPTLDFTSGIVWVGNRENPVLKSEPSVLSLSQNGDLILSQSKKLVWSLNVSRAELVSSTILHLLDTGNLVLRNRTNPKTVLWKSFYHPTNTWFPGAGLGFTKINGENINLSLVSWKDYDDPSPGMYSLQIDSPRPRGFIITKMPENILFFGTFPTWLDIQDLHNGLITFNYTNQSAKDATPYFQLYSTGILQLMHQYNPIWSSPGAICGSRIFCGPYALCVDNGISPSCKCPYGFSNMSSEDVASGSNSAAGPVGCVRNISWNCRHHISNDSNRYSFYLLRDLIKLPDNSQYLGAQSQEGCESACLNNCSCTAYASGAGCNLWYGDLMNIIARDDGLSGEQLYIRLVVSDSTSKLLMKKLIIGGVASIIFVICMILLWMFRGTLLFLRTENKEDQLSIFTYTQIKFATKHFSVKLGEGGFGAVFKGRLFNNIEVAVKKLKIFGQEEKQFRREVQTIGTIRHINLVRLLGFCNEGARRLLIYEYMSNGSLDSHLFKQSSSVLSWQERYKIAIGIARGLSYLHEECRDCIIHCDIKPENVLLDENLFPKIADFGMAKLLGHDLSRVLTTIRGTIGYLAPEWYSGDAITEKADVYSFGMMLFEIVSGKRNTSNSTTEATHTFLFTQLSKLTKEKFCAWWMKNLGKM